MYNIKNSTGGEGDNRGWDGWMASLTRWTWVWVNSGSWWWTGRPGMLRFMGSPRDGHDWANELNWILGNNLFGKRIWKRSVLVTQPCLTLWDPLDYSLSGSSVHGILQAKILEWVSISFSRGSFWPRDRTWVSHFAGRLFTVWATREEAKKNGCMYMCNWTTLLYIWN